MDLIFSGFTTDRILINLQSKFFNASAPTLKIYVGGKLGIRKISKLSNPGDIFKFPVHVCMAFLYDVNAYISTAIFVKNYGRLYFLCDELNSSYKVSVTETEIVVENIGGKKTYVQLVVFN